MTRTGKQALQEWFNEVTEDLIQLRKAFKGISPAVVPVWNDNFAQPRLDQVIPRNLMRRKAERNKRSNAIPGLRS